MEQYYPASKPVTNKCDGMGEKCDELEVVRNTFYVGKRHKRVEHYMIRFT